MTLWYRFYYGLWELFGFEPCGACEKFFKREELWSEHDNMCELCNEYHYCECGQGLYDAWGTPGDGFCRRCD